jgi:hypothetical protein
MIRLLKPPAPRMALPIRDAKYGASSPWTTSEASASTMVL